MKMTTIAMILVFCSSVEQTHATSIKMDYLPAAFVRTDPIISQTCLSDHVHTFYGPQVVRPELDYENLINAPDNINTGNVVENKSLYWHPTVYSYNRQTQTYTRDKMAQSSAYYIWENDTNTKAFPNGFRMIAGLDPTRPENFPNALAECVNPAPCTRPEGCYTENSFFPSTACSELEVSMSFPTCWDGQSLDSDNHQSHMRYTLDGELDGQCPQSHPVRVPQIQLFFRILSYDGGWRTFSDMSSVFHADYISGWESTKLQSVLDNCRTDSFAANPNSFCEQFLTFRDGPKCKDEIICDFGDPQLLAKLEAIQPPPMDIKQAVSPEETEIVSALPRGTCSGELIPLSNSPTRVPTVSVLTTPFPSASPVVPNDVANREEETSEEGEDSEGNSAEEASEEGDAVEEASGEDGEENSDDETRGDGSSAEGTNAEEDSAEEASGEENSAEEANGEGDLAEAASGEGDSAEAASREGDSAEEVSGEGDLAEAASGEGNSAEAASREGDSAEEVSGEEEDGEGSFDEEEFRGFFGTPNQNCGFSCWEGFRTCQAEIDSICEHYFQACKTECREAEDAGEIAEDELSICFDEWCIENKQFCYDEAESRCRQQRRRCLQNCAPGN